MCLHHQQGHSEDMPAPSGRLICTCPVAAHAALVCPCQTEAASVRDSCSCCALGILLSSVPPTQRQPLTISSALGIWSSAASTQPITVAAQQVS